MPVLQRTIICFIPLSSFKPYSFPLFSTASIQFLLFFYYIKSNLFTISNQTFFFTISNQLFFIVYYSIESKVNCLQIGEMLGPVSQCHQACICNYLYFYSLFIYFKSNFKKIFYQFLRIFQTTQFYQLL